MHTESLLDLFDHMTWADSEVWHEVLGNRQAVHDEHLRRLLSHIHSVQHFYLRAWRNDPLDASYPEFSRLPDLYDWAKDYYAEARKHIEALTDDLVDEPMPAAWEERMTRLLGPSVTSARRGDTVMQVILHGLHHRGQANVRLREIGGTPPAIDYVLWVWRGRPAAVWGTTDEESIPG